MGYARVPNGTGPFVIQAATPGDNNILVGTDEAEFEPVGLFLQPNPTTGTFTVRLDRTLEGQTIQVSDMTGRMLYNQEPNSLTTDISGNNWPVGMYIVRYAGEAQRLVVNR